ncbi:MAG: TatD family hydrolase [Breznakiellaceae bacterium]
MVNFYDTHAHLYALKTKHPDLYEALVKPSSDAAPEGRASPENPFPSFIIDVGTDPGDLLPRWEAFAADPQVYLSAGIWPGEQAIRTWSQQVEHLKQDIDRVLYSPGSVGTHQEFPKPRLIAIGECGLDRHWNRDPQIWKQEHQLFEAQLYLAREYNVPVIVHSRDAARETAEILRSVPGVRGVIHCFSYGKEELSSFLDLGFFVSFAGNLTYKKRGPLQEALAACPLNRLLLETDSPYLAPHPYRGKACHPGMIHATYEEAALIHGMATEELAAQIRNNIQTLFGVDLSSPAGEPLR